MRIRFSLAGFCVYRISIVPLADDGGSGQTHRGDFFTKDPFQHVQDEENLLDRCLSTSTRALALNMESGERLN